MFPTAVSVHIFSAASSPRYITSGREKSAADYLLCETAWYLFLGYSSGRLYTNNSTFPNIHLFTNRLQHGLKIRVYQKGCLQLFQNVGKTTSWVSEELSSLNMTAAVFAANVSLDEYACKHFLQQ